MLNKNKLLYEIKKAIPTVLSVISVAGVIGTSVLSSRATLRTKQQMGDTWSEAKELGIPKKRLVFDLIRSYWTNYIPSIIVGATTITCIITTNTINLKHQAALTGIYIFTKDQYDRYKSKVKEIYGKEAHEKVLEALAVEKSKEVHITASSFFENSSLDIGDDKELKRLFYDTFSERYFESTIDKVLQAEYHLNRNFVLQGCVTLDEFYEFLGLDPFSPTYPSDKEFGWSVNDEFYWIDFNHSKCVLDDGLECCIIDMLFEPTADYLDW